MRRTHEARSRPGSYPTQGATAQRICRRCSVSFKKLAQSCDAGYGWVFTHDWAIRDPSVSPLLAPSHKDLIVANRSSKSLRSTAIDTKCPSMGSAMSDMCHLSHFLISGVIGSVEGRPRARHIPLSRTKRAIQHRSLRRTSLRPSSELGSTLLNPPSLRASSGSMQSCLARSPETPFLNASMGIDTLEFWRSMAIVVANDTYQHVSSSVLCTPGPIQGTLIMKARTISVDLCRFSMTLFVSHLQ